MGPKEISDTREPIVIATLLHAEEIRDQIRGLGLSNPVLTLPERPSGAVDVEFHSEDLGA